MYSTRSAQIPSNYKGYPSSASARGHMDFQVLSITVSSTGNSTFVAAESKIWKYDHVIHYAHFEQKQGKEHLVSFESDHIDYGIMAPDHDTIHIRTEALVSEIMMMMPEGSTDLVIDFGKEADGVVTFHESSDTTKDMFEYEHHYSPLGSKQDVLVLVVASEASASAASASASDDES